VRDSWLGAESRLPANRSLGLWRFRLRLDVRAQRKERMSSAGTPAVQRQSRGVAMGIGSSGQYALVTDIEVKPWKTRGGTCDATMSLGDVIPARKFVPAGGDTGVHSSEPGLSADASLHTRAITASAPFRRTSRRLPL
jgi:hypothetical protein